MMNSWECLLLTAVAGIVFVVASATNDPTCEDLYHPNGPRITPCKKEIILHKGQNFSLKCQANSAIQFKQQEVPEENIGNFSVLPRYVTDENAEYKYEITLELQNVDRYAIGYYACIDASVKEDVLNYLIDEPNNTETISYIYIYVDGTDSMYAPMREVVMSKSNGYVVECRPTTPDVQVELLVADIAENTYKRYSPKLGFVFDSDAIEVLTDSVQLTIFTCGFKKQNKTVDKDLFFVKQQKDQPPPRVIGGNKEFLEGESFSLNCSVNYTHNSALNLTWKYPSNSIKNTIIEESNNDLVSGGVFYRNITIVNATKEHAGVYTCFSKNNCGEKQDSFEKKFLDKPYLILKEFVKRESNIIDTTQKTLGFSVEIKSYPPAKFTFYRKDSEINPAKNGKYKVSWKSFSHEAALTVYKDSVEDSDNYTLVATNGYITKNVTYDLRFKTAPVVFFGNTDKTCIQNMRTSLQCEVTGYPLPTVTWIFSDGSEMESKYIEMSSIYKETAILDIQCQFTGNITCKASNERGMQAQTRRLIVYELANGFGIYNQIDNGTIWFSENQEASVKCLASIYDYTNVTWWMDDKNLEEMVEYSENQFSLVAKLKINQISLNHSGTYECRGIRFDGTATFEKVNIEVAELKAPKVTITSNVNENVHKYQPVQLNCQAEGVPRPTIKWYKNDEIFAPNDTNVQVINQIVNRTTVSSNIFIVQMEEEYHGTYECVASNDDKEAKQSTMLVLKEAAYMKYLIVIAIIVFVFIILVIYLTCKIRKEKRFRKELAAAGLLYFKEGVTKSLNPDVGIDEQAELLPYDEKFEFPAEKLTLGKQLGAGAFGVVYKAQARGIINAEETTEVAVKMVKKTADNMFIKALASELKIMVHLGKHINIVNLLGACTKNVGKRELVVIVEYCKFGNIHNYMQRHREVFIDQFSDNNKEKNFGKVNRGYDSTGSTGVQSDYGTANTQDTDHTFLTNNTNRTSRKNVPSQPTEVVKASEGYVQPEWRCNYESDYSYDGRSPRPLTSRDLLAWAFQIARGMEYLASRKVLHGDLAARNILLADDNIVKICDFGLARSIYKNDEYRREKNSLLPVKWLAIECMTDCIFSTQSDVWSFGIVLWELFSLAKTPYPNFSPANLLQFLSEGHRLEKPPYADDRIYNLMRRCWEHKPTARPSFTQLQEILGTFLEDNVRNHYVDLNSAYMDLNSKPEGQEDYLAMVCAPDYNNLVTPSPHHYVNELNDARSFFPPTPTKVDEEGYLQMSPASNNDIFSPKPAGTKFDFDPRKYSSRPSEASSGGSELTPMLTLNNLPRSGSDSDHEGNASPYLNVCPRIEEETDEVFETKLYNAKNAQNSAVSNPTYITLDVDVEKKPIDVNNYVNIVPNGLVK